MKPAPFAYHAPDSVEEVLELLAEHGWDAKLLAGGQSLVPTMNFRLAQPAVLVDLNRVDGLAFIGDPNAGGESDSASTLIRDQGVRATPGGALAVAAGGLAIGAMTRQATVETSPEVAARVPLLAAAMPHIAHPQIRNRGTIGGSIAHADPAAELPAVAVATGAELTIRNRAGRRRIAASEFFQGLFSTALGVDDVLVEIAFPPPPPRSGWAFHEVARRHGDYALVGVAAMLSLGEDRSCETARIVLLSVGTAPVAATAAAESLRGQPISAARLAEAARIAASDDIDPIGDIHASAPFKRHLAEVVVRRALVEAADRAARAALR